METQRYLYETHMHTSEASACAGSTGAQMARAYKEAGYTGIIVTDHFFYGNTSVDRSLPWEEWVRRFCLGYEHAKAEGERIGLSVFFGWEACYEGTEFLVYGLDQAWLLAHPQIKDASIGEQYALVHEGGGIISHAHPFREEDYIPEIRLWMRWRASMPCIPAGRATATRTRCLTSGRWPMEKSTICRLLRDQTSTPRI